MTIFVIFNIALPWVLAFLVSIIQPVNPVDIREIEELRNLEKLTPLVKIISSRKIKTNENIYNLFGGYKLYMHAYNNCSYNFIYTCNSDREDNKIEYCPNDKKKLNYSTCVNDPNIKWFIYRPIGNLYFYAEKKSKEYSFTKLAKYTVKKGENCPIDKKQCGYLTEDSILCLNNTDICPINDIIINNQSTFSIDNITYNHIQFMDDNYIHYTNEKIDNKIIFDLLFSIEHPLSLIEINNNDYNKIFKLHYSEVDSYYNGNIDNIKVYKQIYNTGITLKQFFNSIGRLGDFENMTSFKTEYLDSNLYIYKKYSVPYLNTSNQFIEFYKLNSSLSNNFIINFILCFLAFLNYGFIHAYGMIYIPIYVLMLVLDSAVIYFFTKDLSTFTNPGIFVYFREKDYFRVFNLTIRIIYLVYAFLQNFVAICFWVFRCKEERQEKEDSEYASLNGKGEIPLYNNE